MKRLALSIVSLCAAFAAAKAEPPNTVWTVTQPASDGSYAYISDGTGWEFAVLKDGRLCPNKLTVGETTATELNFCTVPEINFGYTIKTVSATDLSRGTATTAAKNLLKAVWLPATVTSLETSVFSGYQKLESCVFHADSAPSLGNTVFYNCPVLAHVNLLHGMTLGSGCFTKSSKLTLDGDLLPNSVTTIAQSTFGYLNTDGPSPTLFKDGKIVIGGDDASDITWQSASHGYFEGICLYDITFGAGVSSAGKSCNTISPYYYKGQSTITNVVVRNPGTFAFNDVWTCKFSGQKGIRQYDLAGWVTGTLVGHSTARMTRIRAAKTADWRGLLNTAGSHQAWDSLTAAVQQSYWDNFNGGAVGTGDDVPVGLSNAITVNGLTLPANIWLVFKPGDWPAIKTLVVAGDPADWPAEASETTPFSPTYGLAADIVKSHGETFDATAPRYVVSADGKTLAETVAGTLYRRSEDGLYTNAVRTQTYTGDAARSFAVDTATWTTNEYKLVWTFSNVAYKVEFKSPLLDDLGTWSIDKQPDIRGFYTAGTAVEVSAVPNAANGVKFGEWVDWNGAFDPVPTAQIRLTVGSPLKLQAIFTAHWKSVRSYDDRSGNGPYNYLCDGYWKILYTVSNGKITMYPWTTYGSNWGPTVKSHGTLLDFSKPVDGDIGEIAVLGQKLIHECPTIRQVKIPASVTTIKDGAFLGMHRDTVFEIAGAPELVIGAITGRISGLRLTGGFPTFNYNYGIRSIKDVGDYEMWIAVPKHDPLWKEKCLDTTVVTPWKKLSADVQAKFFENFPDEKRRPFGLSRGKYPFNNQLYSWIFREGLAHPLMLIFK